MAHVGKGEPGGEGLGPSFDLGGINLDGRATASTGQVVVVRVDLAAPVERFASIGHHHVDLVGSNEFLQLGVDGGESQGRSVAGNTGVEFLSTHKPVELGEGLENVPSLLGISNRGHGAIVASVELHIGMILIMLNGMVLKKTSTLLATLALVFTSFNAASAAPKPSVISSVSEWGFLTREVVGSHAVVTSLLTDPNADPHEHEATLGDASAVTRARVVIVNGAGYDSWIKRLLTNRHSTTSVLTVASMLKVPNGANPHLFFNLSAAQALVVKLEHLYQQKGFGSLGASFAQGGPQTLTRLQTMAGTLKIISKSCAGVPVAASEDIVGYLLGAAKLRVVTPKALRLAIGNGVDPSVGDLATALQQLTQHPAFFVYNSQTVTPLTTQLLQQARTHHVPVIKVPEVEIKGTYTSFVQGIISQMKRALVQEGCLK